MGHGSVCLRFNSGLDYSVICLKKILQKLQETCIGMRWLTQYKNGCTGYSGNFFYQKSIIGVIIATIQANNDTIVSKKE